VRKDLRPLALLLSPVWPAPGESGRALRAWDWLQELKLNYRVILLVDEKAGLPFALSPMPTTSDESYFSIQTFPSNPRWRAFAKLFPPICLINPNLSVDWMQWRLDEALKPLVDNLSNQPVARVVVFRLYLHDAAKKIAQCFPEAQLELDMDDVESHTRWSLTGALLRMGHYFSALRMASSAAQFALIEHFVNGPYQKVWLASKEDSQRLRTSLAPTVAHRPNRLPSLPVVTKPPQGLLRLLFVGTLNYAPNEEAVRMLVLHVLPILRTQLLAPWRLCVLGRHASPSLQDFLAACSEVEFVSDALSVSSFYGSSHVVLIPLRAGGGTKFKSLEGFAYQRPVVSTEHGMRGLDAVPGVHYLQAQTPEEFAKAIVLLATDHVLSARLALAGRGLVTPDGTHP
jgi:polysaccharide biosynthesis protein PslH